MLQHKYIIALIYTVALFLDRLDLTIVNITLPTLAKYFHVPITSTDWVTMSFLVALAVSMPISDWLGNKFGHKNIFIISMLMFGLGSTLCAVAPNLTVLIFLRFLQGIGGGILIPVGMTLIYHSYDRSEYASITSFTFLPSLIAPAIAPFIGGVLLDNFGWQMVYVLSGPICLLLAIFSLFFLKVDKPKNTVPLDWLGFIFASALLIDTFYLLSVISKSYFSPIIIILFVILLFLITVFIWRENKFEFPLFDLSYFKNKIFIKANLIQLCFQICHFGAIFLIGMYLQVGIGMAASLAGLIMGMQAFGAMATSRYSVKLYNQYGPKLPITVGLLGVAVLSPFVMLIKNPDAYIFGIILFFIRGIFSGLCGTPIQTLSVIAFPEANIGPVNSIFNACRQVSISLGVAASSVLISVGLKWQHMSGINNFDENNMCTVFNLGFWLLPIVAVIGTAIAQSLDDVK